MAADERIAETRSAVEHLLAREGVEPAESAALLARFPRYSFLRARPDPIAWQAMALRDGGDGAIARVRQAAEGSHALEVFVHAPDRLGLFAAIVITLDRLGLAIQQARALDGPGSTIFDSFQVLPMDPRQPPEPQAVARKLAAVLNGSLERVRPAQRGQPRHLRHFRVSPEIVFEDAADGSATVLSLVCTDRPGLLAAIAEVLRGQRLRVHDARVATFGARAEDVFRVSDGDLALDESRRDALCAALLDKLDGERT